MVESLALNRVSSALRAVLQLQAVHTVHLVDGQAMPVSELLLGFAWFWVFRFLLLMNVADCNILSSVDVCRLSTAFLFPSDGFASKEAGR